METLRYFYHSDHPDHLGSTSWVTDSAKNGVQYCEYLPFGEPLVDQRSTTWSSRYTFSGKERDSETGYSYFGARYYHPDPSIWLSVDPMSDKYPNLTPYAYCANNPVISIDPNGMDTINITYNSNNNQWEFDKPILSKGADVFNVTDANGNKTQTVFDEGNYGERMCVLNLEEVGDCTLGIYHVSGQDDNWATGFVATPDGDPSIKPGSGCRLPDGIYPLSPTYNVDDAKWVQPTVYSARGIKIHPVGITPLEWSKVGQWTDGCYVVGTKYRIRGGKIEFNTAYSRQTSYDFNGFLGASKRDIMGKKNNIGAKFEKGMKKMSLIQKGGKF
jgi:RHS repeat-associated protein